MNSYELNTYRSSSFPMTGNAISGEKIETFVFGSILAGETTTKLEMGSLLQNTTKNV